LFLFFSILEKKFSILKILFLESFSAYRRAADTLNESPENFKKSRNKRFIHD
jgi:hypothetical protein